MDYENLTLLALNSTPPHTDINGIDTTFLLLPYLVLWALLMRALLVRARVVPPVCARCGGHLAQSRPDKPICACDPPESVH